MQLGICLARPAAGKVLSRRARIECGPGRRGGVESRILRRRDRSRLGTQFRRLGISRDRRERSLCRRCRWTASGCRPVAACGTRLLFRSGHDDRRNERIPAGAERAGRCLHGFRPGDRLNRFAGPFILRTLNRRRRGIRFRSCRCPGIRGRGKRSDRRRGGGGLGPRRGCRPGRRPGIVGRRRHLPAHRTGGESEDDRRDRQSVAHPNSLAYVVEEQRAF